MYIAEKREILNKNGVGPAAHPPTKPRKLESIH